MMDTLKAEFRKLLTVRSTYFISALAIVIASFFAFYVEGLKVSPLDLPNPHLFRDDVIAAIANASIFCSILAILLVTHEYRYNTIMHTLTSSNSRTKVLIAKTVVVSLYAVVFVAVVSLVTLVLVRFGMQLKHLTPAPQMFDWGDLAWRCLFFGWGSGMLGLILAMLIRVQVGAIVSLFLLPTLEQLLSLLLKHNSIYMPFMTHEAVLNNPRLGIGTFTPGKAALVFTAYLIGGWLVAWIFFLRRDAN